MSALNGSTAEATGQDERPSGLALLFLFWLTTLLVVLAVWALGVVGGWWMLGLGRALSEPPDPNQPARPPRTRSARVRGQAVMTS